MGKIDCPYGPNRYLQNSSTNITFGQLKKYSSRELIKWAKAFRKDAIYAWDELGIPIIGGQSEDKIIRDFKNVANHDVSKFLRMDQTRGKSDCIVNNTSIGGTCNQFFPTMLKTKDIDNKNLNGLSIYSYFSEDEMLDKFVSAVDKLLTLDPFNTYSKTILVDDGPAENWILKFEPSDRQAFWLRRVIKPKPKQLLVSKKLAKKLVNSGKLKKEQLIGEAENYSIQLYDPKKKIMQYPKVWRIIFDGTPATNFPPLTAKFLYLHFADKMKVKSEEPFIVYDPSAGWAGRLLGALACGNERRIHYIGTDPNPDHWMEELDQTKYDYLGGYFNGNVRTKHRNSFDIYRCGSEEIHEEPEFQKYKGKVDFVFTSPPYFAAEGYSEDKSQSHIKFPEYEMWRDHFLSKTLITAIKWLKFGGYLCLNIADVRFNGKVLPLQSDAIEILNCYEMGRYGNFKMVIRDAPRGSKETSSGIPTTRNFCRIDGKRRKYEPILIYQKVNTDPEFWPDEAKKHANSILGYDYY